MTTPVVTAPCEVCASEPAAMSMMNLADYSAIKVGNGCMPAFFASLATDLVAASDPSHVHADGLAVCPACSDIHHLVMAMAAAPEADAAGEASAGDGQDQAAAADTADDFVQDRRADLDPNRDEAAEAPPAGAAADLPASGPVREPSGADTASDRVRVSELQRELLVMAGITGPDSAPCPACETDCYTAPGAASYLCPWCGGRFSTAPAAGMAPLVIDATDGNRGDAAPPAGDLSDSPADAGVTPAL